MPTRTPNSLLRLRRHADYQRVYTSSRKQFARQITFFYSLRPDGRRSDTPGPRIGLTVGKVLGQAVERNRIKRRLRELIRRHAGLLGPYPVDVILHPRRSVLEMQSLLLEREVIQVFQTIRKALNHPQDPGPNHRPGHPQQASPARSQRPRRPPAPAPAAPGPPPQPAAPPRRP